MTWFRAMGSLGGSDGKSLVLPTNPTIEIENDDSKLDVTWAQPTSETEIVKYNIYKSTTKPNSLKDMTFVGETTSTSYSITGLTNLIIYYVAVASVDINGYENASIWQVKNGFPKKLRFVACGSNIIKYSDDGNNWYPANILGLDSLSDKYFHALTYGNNMFVAISYDGNVFNSVDGINWTKVKTFTGTYTKNHDALIYAGGKFVAIGANSTPIYSIDGVKWYEGTRQTSSAFHSIIYINNKYMTTALAGTGSSGYIWESSTGINGWATTSNVVGRPFALYYANDKILCLCQNGTIRYSPDYGVTWSAASVVSGYSGTYKSAAYGMDRFVAVGTEGKAVYSTNGINWTNMTGTGSKDLTYVTYARGRFICVGDGGIYYSDNGTTWTASSEADLGQYSEVVSNIIDD